MISMLCQKSNNGTITSTKNRDLFNFLLLGEPVKKPIELFRREASFNNYLDQNHVVNLVNIDIESKSNQENDIRINKVNRKLIFLKFNKIK
jgi:hypothetical protein